MFPAAPVTAILFGGSLLMTLVSAGAAALPQKDLVAVLAMVDWNLIDFEYQEFRFHFHF